MAPLFGWDQPVPETPPKPRASSRTKPPAYRLWEHEGKLVVDRFGPDWVLRLACSDPLLEAEPGLDRWVAHRRMHKLLEPCGPKASVRHDESTARTTMFYAGANAQIPLTLTRDMSQPPKHAWDPDSGVNQPLDRPHFVELDLFREQTEWARRFLAHRDCFGIQIDRNQIGRIECRGLGLAYQAMSGWPAMTLLPHHLRLLGQLLKQAYQPLSEKKKKVAADNETVVIQRHDYGPEQTSYWVFHRLGTPSFLAVRCHTDTVQPHDPYITADETTLLVIPARSFIPDYMRLVARVAEKTVELSVYSDGAECYELRVGTPDIERGIWFRVPLRSGLATTGFKLLKLNQGRFTRALTVADSPSDHIALRLDRSQKTLRVTSVASPTCDSAEDQLGRSVSFGINRFEL